MTPPTWPWRAAKLGLRPADQTMFFRAVLIHAALLTCAAASSSSKCAPETATPAACADVASRVRRQCPYSCGVADAVKRELIATRRGDAVAPANSPLVAQLQSALDRLLRDDGQPLSAAPAAFAAACVDLTSRLQASSRAASPADGAAVTPIGGSLGYPLTAIAALLLQFEVGVRSPPPPRLPKWYTS